jgi:7,8-dihydroneopterin aldolase/epimerase/oxygenase
MSWPDDAEMHDATSLPPTAAVGRDRIIVDGLVVDAFIGVLDGERLGRQPVRFDVEVRTVDGYAELVRATGRYVSYADVVGFIEERAASDEHVDLVETWAEDVAAVALANPLAESVCVTVRKLAIFDAADGVGITIERRRADGA